MPASIFADDQSALQFLGKLVAIESVSTDSSRKDRLVMAKQFLKAHLESIGFVTHEYTVPNAAPLLVATLNVNPKGKTIGIYGHYDVQPEDPVDQWTSPPFMLTERGGKLCGRGVGDNKGHLAQNIFAIQRAYSEGKLKNNIVLVIEGQEETGSNSFEAYVKRAKNILKDVDVWYIADTGMADEKTAQIYYGLRGLVYFEIWVSIGTHDLHSGVYGNSVHNPVQVLSTLFGSMKDRRGHITIPKFSNDVRKMTAAEKYSLETEEHNGKKGKSGVYTYLSIDPKYPRLSAKIFPSMDIHGIVSGYTGEGEKTIIPSMAQAKFSFRLVEHQEPDTIEALVRTYVKKHMPEGVKYTLKTLSKSSPFYTSMNQPLVKKTTDIFRAYFGKKTVFTRSGGTIPAAEVMQRIFAKPVIPTGCLKDYNIHAPNEYIEKKAFLTGIGALEKLYSEL